MPADERTTNLGPFGPRILIVRPAPLGDVSRTVPALVTLRRAHPDATIDWLVNDAFAEVVAHHPDLNAVIPFPRQRFKALYNPLRMLGFAKWLLGIRQRKYDMVVDLQGLFRSGFITRCSGAGERIGFADAHERAWYGYNRRMEVPADQHTVDRMLGLLQAADYEPIRDMRLYVGADDMRWLEELEFADKPYACIAPTAKWRCKCWPIEAWADLARRLLAETRIEHVIVVASPHERPQVQPLLDELGPDVPVSFHETTVGKVMALLKRCELLVSNDSASLHIAVGLERPVVGIFGPTDPKLVGPYGRDDSVVQPDGIRQEDMARYRSLRDDQSLIARVSVDQVWGKAVERIGAEDIAIVQPNVEIHPAS